MAKYTIELRTLLEDIYTRTQIYRSLTSYPLYIPISNNDEVRAIIPTRTQLNEKLLNHYKYSEIAFESIEEFIDKLEITMNEIMPYYNQLYKTTLFEYDPIHNVDYVEETTTNRDSEGNVVNKETGTSEGSGTVTGQSTSESTSNSDTNATQNNKQVTVDTPQGNVAEILDGQYDYASEVKTEANSENTNTQNHGTASSNDTSTTETSSKLTNDYESTSKRDETETFKKHLKGNYGVTTSQNMIKQEREIIINIDMKIINDLRFLFLNVF